MMACYCTLILLQLLQLLRFCSVSVGLMMKTDGASKIHCPRDRARSDCPDKSYR